MDFAAVDDVADIEPVFQHVEEPAGTEALPASNETPEMRRLRLVRLANAIDTFGYIAALLVLLAFYMRAMVPLRAIALCSNAAFLAYGIGLDLLPVIVLHAALMPINAWRWWQAAQGEPGPDK
jgi:hypothetical protein